MLQFPRFFFKDHSPFNVKSEPQERMMQVIRATPEEDGLIVAPCGSGKSAVLIEAAMEAGTMVLIFCYEAQGVHQIVHDLQEHTTLHDAAICKYTGKDKDKENPHFCYLVTTYGMFAGPESKRSETSKKMRDFVMKTKWDLICCDEAHHMCAETYRPMIEKLFAKRKLGFTATPYRSDCYTVAQDEEEHIKKAFSWFGKVLVHIPWREVETAGLIARIGRARVNVELTPEFRAAYTMSAASQKQYLAALNPAKLDALVAICAMHKAFNHGGIVFVTHLVVANVVQRCLTRCLGEGWAVLSGGSAHGEDETHTPSQNANIVKQFNNGELRGLVCTNVAAGAMDIPDCRFAIDLDTDGGRANMAQRYGRITRTQRVHAKSGESPEDLLARRLEKQKEAWYYDLVTRDTEDESVAQRRHAFFSSEGYSEEIDMPVDALTGKVGEEGVALPYATLANQMALLKEVLQYNALKDVCAGANAAASKAKLPFSAEVKRLEDARDKTPSAVMKGKYTAAIARAKREQKQAAEEAKVVRRKTIDNAALNEGALEIFRSLRLGASVLEEAGLMEVAFAPSDDDEY